MAGAQRRHHQQMSWPRVAREVIENIPAVVIVEFGVEGGTLPGRGSLTREGVGGLALLLQGGSNGVDARLGVGGSLGGASCSVSEEDALTSAIGGGLPFAIAGGGRLVISGGSGLAIGGSLAIGVGDGIDQEKVGHGGWLVFAEAVGHKKEEN
ncbi:hypothetical protein E2562_014124 [Oryza meyeriana var. granulata]|uniref:Uncharacterized protein n=1 Tax=Oryza meyeriana var. granulata TaxID=110450 RepID=A0A6G1F8E9_9ORYZ|nr:hypothetical protein E2562_014124 [Oryza meyeriana var. granulata]